jgi:hypothetical protein
MAQELPRYEIKITYWLGIIIEKLDALCQSLEYNPKRENIAEDNKNLAIIMVL